MPRRPAFTKPGRAGLLAAMQARPLLALFAAALAAAPLAAQKPEGDKTDPGRRWREQGIAMCVAELRAVEGMTPDDLEAICGCAFERFMPNPPAGAPSEPGRDRLRGALGGPVLACAAQQRPALASAVARWLADRPPVSRVSPPPAPAPVVEPDKPESAAAPESAGPGFSLRAWWAGLGWPRWLSGSGVPLWVWLPLVLLVLVLFARRFRRDSSRDLIRPPSHMRRTTVRPGPPPVR